MWQQHSSHTNGGQCFFFGIIATHLHHSPPSPIPLHTFTSTLHPFTDIDSQLEHTSHLLGQLEEEQRDRLSQAPLELDDGHLVLPGPSDEEVRIASDLRAGLAQLTAQVLIIILSCMHPPLVFSKSHSFISLHYRLRYYRHPNFIVFPFFPYSNEHVVIS